MSRMNGIFIVVLLIVVVGAGYCAEPQSALDELLEQWTDSLLNEDIDGFLDCYWDDAVRISYNPGGESSMTQGEADMRVEQAESLGMFDFKSMGLIYDEPLRFFPDKGNPTYIYPNSRFAFMDVFEFEKRRGEYRIIRQYLMPHPGQE